MSEKLVLWKPRSQRLAESFIIPLILFSVGPILRMLLGTEYQIYYGLMAWFPLMFLVTFIARQWAVGHGGEWMTPAERLQRLLAEMGSAPRAQTALRTASMYALIMCALLFTVEPISDFGEGIGGPWGAAGLIAIVSLAVAIPTLTGRTRRLASISVEQNHAPPREVISESLRLMPRSYMATLIGTISGVLIGLQLEGTLRIAGSVVAILFIPQALRLLPFFGKLPRKLYPSFASSGFWLCMAYGIACWGIPYAIMFSGFAALLDAGNQWTMPITTSLGYAMGWSVLVGVLMGVWVYVLGRATQRRAMGKPA